MNWRRLLLPLVPVYAGVIDTKAWLWERGWLPQRRLRHPVISVGSLSAGGAGKTPVVIMLAELLQSEGYEVRILTRGYGRRVKIVQRVDPAGTARQFGDEPLLMARRLPKASVWVGTDRHRAGKLAEKNDPPDAQVIYLLDDGFQHRKLWRDVDVVLLTRRDLEDRLLPVGNLREPLRSMRRAHVAVLREEDGFTGRLSGRAATWFVRRKLYFVDADMPRHPLAFCGLARPEGFFAMLKAAGIEVAATSVFRDHHAYGDRDIEQLLRLAQDCGANGFVTSEKDAVKLSAGMMKKLRSVGPVAAPGLEVELLDESAALKKLMELVARKAS